MVADPGTWAQPRALLEGGSSFPDKAVLRGEELEQQEEEQPMPHVQLSFCKGQVGV